MIMKTIEISEELCERLKMCVVDPFDDTPDSVINRLIDIVEKAKSNCSAWDVQTAEAVVVQGEEQSAKVDDDSAVEEEHAWNKPAGVAL
jgi:hypothetical protein